MERARTGELVADRYETKPPKPPALVLAIGSQRTPRHARLAFVARGTGEPADAWLAPVVERMLRQALREREDRRFDVDRADGATWIDLAYAWAEGRLRIEARIRGEERLVAVASARSVAGAVRELADALEGRLGAGLEPIEPEPAELEEMRRAGAISVPLFRRYRNAVRAVFATILPDAPGVADVVRGIIAGDPGWAHPYALLAMLEGITTESGRGVLAAALRAASPARDPSGMDLLRALELISTGAQEDAFPLLDAVFRRDDADLLAGAVLMMTAVVVHRTEEAAALARRLHVQHPELAFGIDLAEALRREAREADAERVIRQWAALAPESAGARLQLARIEAGTGRLDEARARAREALAVHGEHQEVLPDLFEALVETEQIPEARAIADQMLVGSPLSRARGRHRAAVAALFQGRFAAAYDAARRAIAEHRAFGMQSELTQCLELARSLAPLVADAAAVRRHTEELAGVFANLIGDAGAAAATRFELALLDRRGPPPSIDEHLAGLPDSAARDVARRRMLRAAATADCGSPHKAAAAGFSAFEENTASLLALGMCAWRVRELDLARRSLERAVRRWSTLNANQCSPYHAILARFHLGGVLAELGDRAAARAAYESFLRCWADPDRPVPEVAIARQLLEGSVLAP